MSTISRIQDALAELADELAQAERLVEEQARRIEALESELAVLHDLLGRAAA